MSHRPLAFLLTFVSLFFANSAFADDANWSTFGGAGAFSPNRQVRMERENVRIELEKETIRVHATFWFQNRGPATKVRMAFPDETADQGRETKPPIRRFRSEVDGRPVPVRRERLKNGFRGDWGVDIYRSAWVKTVSFAQNGGRKVDVWYTADRGFAGAGLAFDSYVFRTGSTWRGTIVRIETTVDWSRQGNRSRPALRLTASAPGARWTSLGTHRARLIVRDVKPTFDLDLTTVEGFWHFRLNGRTLLPRLGMDEFGPVVAGRPEDLRIAATQLGALFDEDYRKGGTTVEDTVWRAPEARRFGGRLSLLGTQTLVTGKGKRLLLAHPATDRQGRPYTASLREKDETPYVRVRDVFAALGGRYRYVPSEDRVDLTLVPHKSTPQIR